MKTWMHVTMLVVGIVLAIGEGIALFNKDAGDTVSEVVRDWNVWSGGLIALVSLAVWWHWFGYVPESWR